MPLKLAPSFVFRYSLLLRTLLSVFFLCVALMGTAGYMFIVSRTASAVNTLVATENHLAHVTAASLGLAMWNLDNKQINEQLAALQQDSIEFCGARVLDAQGQVMNSLGWNANLSDNQINIKTPIKYLNPSKPEAGLETLGQLEMCADSSFMRAELNQKNKERTVEIFLLSLAITAICFLSLIFIIRPLVKIRRAMSRLPEKMEPITDRQLLKNDEIGYLATTFNTMVEDLTRTHQSLLLEKKNAEAANEAKSAFLATMSHELRTPLNSIIGFTQLLADTSMEEEQKEMVGLVQKSSKNLLAIVNDILDLAKIEARETKLENTAFDIYQVIRHTVRSLLPLTAKKGIALTYTTDSKCMYVLGDPLRFTRILTNLINNAVTYTDRGSVTITAHVEHISADHVRFICDVTDTGIGIAKEQQEKIFDKFIQADTSITRRYGGTGLGLTITRELVLLMQGTIIVESTLGKGSTFRILIPFKTFQELPQNMAPSQPLPVSKTALPAGQVKILLAEDHHMNWLFMKKLFKNLNIEHYKIVENGEDAVKQVEIEQYDLILMDIHMPVMNGYGATLAIRALTDSKKKNIPIIAITADGMLSDEQRCLQLGMNAFISKPFDIMAFKKKLSPWIRFDTPADTQEIVQMQPAVNTLVNLEGLIANSAGDKTFVKEMIALFVSHGSEQISLLKSQCTDGKNEEWVEIAHSLKGTAGNVGAADMRTLCAEAQDMVEASAEQRRNKLKDIEDQYHLVCTVLAEKKTHTA